MKNILEQDSLQHPIQYIRILGVLTLSSIVNYTNISLFLKKILI